MSRKLLLSRKFEKLDISTRVELNISTVSEPI